MSLWYSFSASTEASAPAVLSFKQHYEYMYISYSGYFSGKIFVVEQYLASSWFIYSWWLLVLQVKVGKVASFG